MSVITPSSYSSDSFYSVARKEVEEAFPKQGLISFADGCRFLGIPLQTARNQRSAGDFPLPVITQQPGRRIYFAAVVLAEYLACLLSGVEYQRPALTDTRSPFRPNSSHQSDVSRKRPGRPSFAEKPPADRRRQEFAKRRRQEGEIHASTMQSMVNR